MLQKTLESPLDCKEIQPVHPKGDQSWVFIERTDVEAATPIFGHLMGRADSFEKTLMLGKIEGRRRRGQQKMRRLDGITDSMDMGLGELLGLVCCSPWLFTSGDQSVGVAKHEKYANPGDGAEKEMLDSYTSHWGRAPSVHFLFSKLDQFLSSP